jgi:DNA polymerase III epsilon subunit-like protein
MIALDIESSGLDPERTSILSIGALDTDEPANQFYGECRIWGPDAQGQFATINDEALAINGFTQEGAVDANKKTEAQLVTAFIEWLATTSINKTIVGQNSSFDRDFMRAACRRAGAEFPFAHRTIDTHSLVWLHMIQHGIEPPTYESKTTGVQQSGISLTIALEYCGLPAEEKPHNALNGAFAHAEVFSRIAFNKKSLPQYSSYEIPWQ